MGSARRSFAVPVVIREADEAEVIEIALIENIQRKDLTAFEEAEALSMLCDAHGHTHEQLAKRLGKSRTAITESLTLNGMPEEIKNLCRLADITPKSLLLQVVRQGDKKKMIALVEQLSRGAGPTTREMARAATAKAKPGRPKAFTFKYVPPAKTFNLSLKFRKARVDRDEIITALSEIIEELKQAD